MQLPLEPPSPSELARSPRERVLLLSSKVGAGAVALWCAELLAGGSCDAASLRWIGGRHAVAAQDHLEDHWPRVWAARALLYAWAPGAEPAVLAGLHDPAWRVREMCAKVARLRGLQRAEPILAHLLDDRVLRVRAAAEAALTEAAGPPD